MQPRQGANVGAATRGSGRRRRTLYVPGALGLLGALAVRLAFPGQRLGMAFTLGSGIGTAALQTRIDALEERAIFGKGFSEDE